MYLYECPDCRRLHDEPAEATIRLHVRCLDCELASSYHEDVVLTIVVSRAA